MNQRSPDEIFDTILSWNIRSYYKLAAHFRTINTREAQLMMQLCIIGVRQNIAARQALREVVIEPMEAIGALPEPKPDLTPGELKDVEELWRIHNLDERTETTNPQDPSSDYPEGCIYECRPPGPPGTARFIGTPRRRPDSDPGQDNDLRELGRG